MPRSRQVSASRRIAADRQTLFDVLADPRQHPVIDGSGTVEDVQPGGPERLGPGVRFGMAMRIGAPYRILNTVLEFEEGRRLTWRHFHGHTWSYELEDAPGGGTDVTERFTWSDARFPWVVELLGWPARNRRAMERTLANLDALVTGRDVAR